MTINDIAEKALAKAGEILDNSGHWDGPGSTKASAEAVAVLVGVGSVDKGVAKTTPAKSEPEEKKTTGK